MSKNQQEKGKLSEVVLKHWVKILCLKVFETPPSERLGLCTFPWNLGSLVTRQPRVCLSNAVQFLRLYHERQCQGSLSQTLTLGALTLYVAVHLF